MATGKPVMFLRTALTEQRIDDLERQIAWIKKHLKVPDEPTQSDEEWEAARPPKPPEPEPEEPEPPKKTAAKGKRG